LDIIVQINAKNKSLLIIPASALIVVLLLASVMQAYFDWSQRTAWIGAAIAALPLPFLLLRMQLSPVERTSENLPSLLMLAGTGFVIAVWQHLVEQQSDWVPTAVAGLAALIFLLYVFWYSRFGRLASRHLSVGGVLPDFELRDSAGELFNSDSLAGAPAVVMFYRGNWCPFCVAQIAEIVDRYKDLEALGVNIVMISSQSDINSQNLARKFDVPITFLVDKDNQLAERLDIAANNVVPIGLPGDYVADAAMPTLIVANASGTIVFSDQTDNYRVRPEPDVFLAILRRTGAKSK
jgi:peroxiredoxin